MMDSLVDDTNESFLKRRNRTQHRNAFGVAIFGAKNIPTASSAESHFAKELLNE